MFKGCFAWVSQSSWWNVIARLLADDESSADYDSSADDDYDDDGDAVTELLVSAADDDYDDDGDAVTEFLVSAADDDYDDDGDAVTELLVSAQDGLLADSVLSILRNNPGLIRVADPAGDTVLHVASRAGDMDTTCKLIAFIKARPDLERRLIDTNVDGDTPLHVAIKNGHKETAYHLAIAQDPMEYIRNNDGKTAHQLAIKAGYDELCYVLEGPCRKPLSCRVDFEMSYVMKDLKGMTKRVPKHWMKIYKAIQKSEENTLATVLRRVRDGKKLLWYHGELGRTLLHEAVKVSGQGPFNQLVQFMISNGLTDAALLKDYEGDTALHCAVPSKTLSKAFDLVKVASMAASHCAVHSEQLSKALDLIKVAPRAAYQLNKKRVSPLYLAVKGNYQDLVMNMFNMLSRSSVPGYASEILLHPKNAILAHRAIKSRNLGTLQTVMEHLPELINKTDKRGWRPLSYAANIGHLEAVNYLLTNFPNSVEEVDRDGSLPIHKAVAGGKVNIIEAFLSHCPLALQHVDIKGRSVLHIAVRYARADILDYLNNNIKMDDSFLNLKDNQGKTCMDHATRN